MVAKSSSRMRRTGFSSPSGFQDSAGMIGSRASEASSGGAA
jgi:hypothetical protein